MSRSMNTTFVGLDVHKKSINVAAILEGENHVSEEWQLEINPRAVKKMANRLKKSSSGPIVAFYEAGPCGYAFLHQVEQLGIDCRVVAPSLIPMKPGERVKTDRRDAAKLATMGRAGLLTEIQPPTSEEEAVRDLSRAREDAKKDLLSARHRLSKMLLRHGYVFSGGTNWTHRHRCWLKGIRFDNISLQQVFDNYLLSIEQIEERVKILDSHLEEVAQSKPYAERVGWLRCLRGVDTITAMTILAELHDFRRFANPRDLMSYLGLTPSEYSSGNRTKKGAITKAGNSHARRIFVEAAWAYRHRPSVSGALKKRRDGQPTAVIAISDRAQERLHKKYYKLKEGYHKPHNVAVVAVARELVGFIWAVLNHQRAVCS